MEAAAPFEATPRDLNTASFPAQRAAKEAATSGCPLQYAISFSVKFLAINVGLCDGTEEINSKQPNPNDQ